MYPFIVLLMCVCVCVCSTSSVFTMAETKGKFDFAIDRGGTFTDVFARLPDGREKVLKLLSRDPQNYKDAPTEGIRRILEEVHLMILY